MRDGEERDAMKLDTFYGGVGVEDRIEEKVATLMRTQPDHRTGNKSGDRSSLIHTLSGIILLSFGHARVAD